VQELLNKALSGFADNGHSLFSPSGASTWGNCAGSAIGLHDARRDDPDNVPSVEGTLGHFCLEVCLSTRIYPVDIKKAQVQPFIEEVTKWRNGVLANKANTAKVRVFVIECHRRFCNADFDSEMVIEIAKTCRVVYQYTSQGYELYPELRVSLELFMGHTQCDGTSDIVLIKGTHLIVGDLKYGQALAVFPENNWQIMLYALGVIAWCISRGIDIDTVDLAISQSRIDNNLWDVWHTTYHQIYNECIPKLKDASVKALEVLAYPEKVTKDHFNPSEKACTWCHRRHTCVARSRFTQNILLEHYRKLDPLQSTNWKPDNPFVDCIDSAALKDVIQAKPFIIGWLNAAEKEADRRCKKGDTDLGLKLVKGSRRRSYYTTQQPKIIADIVACGVPFSDAVTIKPKSPAQLDKTNMSSDVRTKIRELVKTAEGNPIVALESDRRPAIKPLDANQYFKPLDANQFFK